MRTFDQLFAGRTDCYGVYLVKEKRNDGKLKGRGDTRREPLPPGIYDDHLAGKIMLGIVPIKLDGTVNWFASDIDEYNIDLVDLDKKCQQHEIPVVVCRTKSGGAHLYCFVRGSIPAGEAIRLMKGWIAQLGYPRAEVFPKQVSVTEDSVGNWINLPYFDAKHTDRYAIGLSGEHLDLKQFIQLAEARSIKPTEVAGLGKKKAKPVVADMPPCIQQMWADGVTEGGRNNALTHMGVYYLMASPDNWEQMVRTAAIDYFDPHLDDEEVTQIIKNLRPRKYQYLCNLEPMAGLCNKELCLTRKWGVGPQRGTNFGSFEFGILTMLTSDPPVWIWDVNGRPVSMTTDQLTSPSKFRNRLVDVLGVLPPKMKGSEHDRMVAEAMASKLVEDVPEEVSLNGLVVEAFKSWVVANAPRSRQLTDVLRGLPFYIVEENVLVFKGQDFTSYFYRETKSNYAARDIWAAMKKAGASLHNKRISSAELGTENQVKLWHYQVDKPWFKIPGQEKF